MSDEPTNWTHAADDLCSAMLKQAPMHIEKISDALYEGLLNDVQAYLRENVDYNLSHELRRAKGDAGVANNALAAVALELGVETKGFPNYPTPGMVEDQCVGAIGKMRAALSETEQVGMKPEGRNENQNTFNNGDTWPPVGWKEIE